VELSCMLSFVIEDGRWGFPPVCIDRHRTTAQFCGSEHAPLVSGSSANIGLTGATTDGENSAQTLHGLSRGRDRRRQQRRTLLSHHHGHGESFGPMSSVSSMGFAVCFLLLEATAWLVELAALRDGWCRAMSGFRMPMVRSTIGCAWSRAASFCSEPLTTAALSRRLQLQLAWVYDTRCCVYGLSRRRLRPPETCGHGHKTCKGHVQSAAPIGPYGTVWSGAVGGAVAKKQLAGPGFDARFFVGEPLGNDAPARRTRRARDLIGQCALASLSAHLSRPGKRALALLVRSPPSPLAFTLPPPLRTRPRRRSSRALPLVLPLSPPLALSPSQPHLLLVAAPTASTTSASAFQPPPRAHPAPI
jgi:hypothetical protein